MRPDPDPAGGVLIEPRHRGFGFLGSHQRRRRECGRPGRPPPQAAPCTDPQVPVAIVQNRLHATFGKPIGPCGGKRHELIQMVCVHMVQATLGANPQAALAVAGD